MSRLPVITAAFNEQDHIGQFLRALPPEIEPVVVANGCSDDTVEITRSYGIEPIVLEQPSKMAALQAGIKSLGERALEGFAIVDADTRPAFPLAWARTMRSKLAEDVSVVFCGPLVYGAERGKLVGMVRSARSLARDVKAGLTHSNRLYGANMAVKPNDAALEEMLSLPANLWPGEDIAIKDSIIRQGGSYRMEPDPRLLAVTSARAHTDLAKRLLKGRKWGQEQCDKWYGSKAPQDAVSYTDWRMSSSVNDEPRV